MGTVTEWEMASPTRQAYLVLRWTPLLLAGVLALLLTLLSEHRVDVQRYHDAPACAVTPNASCRALVAGRVRRQYLVVSYAEDATPGTTGTEPTVTSTTLHLVVDLPGGTHDFAIGERVPVDPEQFASDATVQIERWRGNYTRVIAPNGDIAETEDNPDYHVYDDVNGVAVTGVAFLLTSVGLLIWRWRMQPRKAAE